MNTNSPWLRDDQCAGGDALIPGLQMIRPTKPSPPATNDIPGDELEVGEVTAVPRVATYTRGLEKLIYWPDEHGMVHYYGVWNDEHARRLVEESGIEQELVFEGLAAIKKPKRRY